MGVKINTIRSVRRLWKRKVPPASPPTNVIPCPNDGGGEFITTKAMRKRDKIRSLFIHHKPQLNTFEDLLTMNETADLKQYEILTLDPFASQNEVNHLSINQVNNLFGNSQSNLSFQDTSTRDSKLGLKLDNGLHNLLQPPNGGLDLQWFRSHNAGETPNDNNNQDQHDIEENQNDPFMSRYQHSFELTQPPKILPKENYGKWERSQMLRHAASLHSLKRKRLAHFDINVASHTSNTDPLTDPEISIDITDVCGISEDLPPQQDNQMYAVVNVSTFFKSVGSLFIPSPEKKTFYPISN